MHVSRELVLIQWTSSAVLGYRSCCGLMEAASCMHDMAMNTEQSRESKHGENFQPVAVSGAVV